MTSEAANGRAAAKDRALDYVKAKVLTGEFPGGELISEGEVATALGMSRTPVREAFLQLEAAGLLRLYPKRGALVVPVSPDEVRAVLEARMVLEEFAVRAVIQRGPDACAAVYERLSAQVQRQREAAAASRLHEFLDSDRAFHNVTLEAAGNAILAGFYSSLRDRQMRMIGESARNPQRLATIIEEHERIARALRDTDADAARAAVRAHLAGTMRALGLAVAGELGL
ncbi:GntR family transcriptional regulator [Mycobacterium gordonae]|uniref:GntR family transcriptional regulator n=1 Tax=Mycobacterium gordonae TaxID=1778 RepID=A0A1X1W2G9_MYCGO|nr:GntR family transcriptional regulator [Mycobacterium gordonae]PJE08891.1 MAG: GntR family transcriptional regulator [Mycobacterium sp.]MCQ4364272.1 GntR family transcriptional regulator [Mycobacterium gordonae]MCV7005166.1 GntR family transcriptional regulator [Mycobacterium gordonae]ODR19916.1 GntR family transcriptional regulator [Mycobacterium gordonae]ORV80795.1 GntR family transcriptional regulator [Mycobacterium gordonae]